MKLTVRLFGDLRRYLPAGQETLLLELPVGSTVASVLQQIGIHPGEVWVVRANRRVVPEDRLLQDGDDVELFEPVGGGSEDVTQSAAVPEGGFPRALHSPTTNNPATKPPM